MRAERKAVLDLYIGNFAARSDAYVRDSRAHVNEALDAELAETALHEGFAISGYMAWKEDGGTYATHIGAIDFDMEDGFDRAIEVRSFLGSQGLDSLLVSSRRGAHLWVQSGWQPVPAATMRRALRAALTLCGIESEKAEVFPKRSHSDWGVGALRMPLMRHPKTGVIYPAYDPFEGGEVVDVRSLVMVMADLQTSSEALTRLAGPETPPSAYPLHNAVMSMPAWQRGDAPLVTMLLAGMGVDARPGHSIRCPFHDDRHASLQVASDDLRAWCKAPSCPLHNGGVGLGSVELAKYMKDTHHAAPT